MTSFNQSEIEAAASVSDSHTSVSLLGGDTETTGFEAKKDRVIELALLDFSPVTGAVSPQGALHMYFNPERDVPEATSNIHGLTGEFLAGQPLFKEKRDEVAARLEGRTFVAHNAQFDVRMLEGEFALTRARGAPVITLQSLGCRVVDTLAMARQYVRTESRTFTLDALLSHFGIPAVGREKFHGAAVDVALMASVYPYIAATRNTYRKNIDVLLTESLDAPLPAGDLDEIVRRYMELESIRKFLEKEKERLEEFFVSVQGKGDWSGAQYCAKLSTSTQVDWAKVRERHLKDLDLTEFSKPISRFTLKAND